MAGLSEKIRIDERDKIITYIDFVLYNSKETSTDCKECDDVELRLLRQRLVSMNREAEEN